MSDTPKKRQFSPINNIRQNSCSNHSSLKLIYQEFNFEGLYQIFKVKFSNQTDFDEEGKVDIYVSDMVWKK